MSGFQSRSPVLNRGPNIPDEPGDGKPSSRPERLSCIVEEGSVGAAESFENLASCRRTLKRNSTLAQN